MPGPRRFPSDGSHTQGKEAPVNDMYLVQAPNAHGGTSLGYARGADPWSAARAAGAQFAEPERDAQADTELEAGA
jgi:hypothetical protein